MAVKFAAIMLNEQPVAEHIHPPSSEQRWLGCPGCDEEALANAPQAADTYIAAVLVRREGRGPVDLEADQRTRRQPSSRQIAEATVALASQETAEGRVYTIHLLVNSHRGWWTGNEVVRPSRGAFTPPTTRQRRRPGSPAKSPLLSYPPASPWAPAGPPTTPTGPA